MEIRDLASCRRVRDQGERPFCLPSPISVLLATWMADGPETPQQIALGDRTKRGDGWDESKRRISKRGTNSSTESGFFTESRAVAFDIRFKMDLEGPFTRNEAKGEDQVQILEARENTR